MSQISIITEISIAFLPFREIVSWPLRDRLILLFLIDEGNNYVLIYMHCDNDAGPFREIYVGRGRFMLTIKNIIEI